MAINIRLASGSGVAEKWRRQHQLLRGGTQWATTDKKEQEIHNQLCALGSDPDIAIIAEIIGNKSWSYLFCQGCDEYVTKAAEFPIYGDAATYVCTECLDKSLLAIKVKAGMGKEVR